MKIRTILIGSAMAIAAPAIAQDAAPMPEPAPTTSTVPAPAPVDTATPAPVDPAAPAPVTTTAPAPAPEPAKTQRATSDQIATVVKDNFAKYDTDSSGELSATEFTTWMTDVATASKAPTPTAQWFTSAFAQADADKNKTVSQAELVTFLNG